MKSSKAIKSLLVLSSMSVIALGAFTSCGNNNGEKVYSNVTNKLKLTVDYKDKHFINDGIGEATLLKLTDGDTSTFRLTSGESVTIRYYGIDTPESTGSVEKWGKSASKFTENALKNAKYIVLEGSTSPASHDSYGSRYLGYVWYKTDDKSDWKNLNLQIVENGFSKNKNINNDKYKYYSYFAEAEAFAQKKELHLWGDKEDPYFSTDPEILDLKQLSENIDQYYNEETNTGSKVRFTAYTRYLNISGTSSQTYTFSVGQIIDGKEYYFSVYCGYSTSNAAKFMKIGKLYTFTGTIQKHENGYQLSGIEYVPLQSGGDKLTLVQDKYYYTFDSYTEYASYWGTSLYNEATITEAKKNGDNIEIVAKSKSKDSEDAIEETFTFVTPFNSNIDITNAVGKKLSTAGVQEELDSHIIFVSDPYKLSIHN